jgi:hypothetical protein
MALDLYENLARRYDLAFDRFEEHDPSEHSRGLDVWTAELTPLLWEDQQRLLAEAGFRSVDFFGTFELDPYDEALSDKLIAVAHV